jgi:hypothetical protein
MRGLLLVAILLAISLPSPAVVAKEVSTCPHELIEAVAKHYGLINIEAKGEPVLDEVCRTWPYDGDLVLSAFVYDASLAFSGAPQTVATNADVLDLYVSVFNHKTGKLVGTYTHKVYQDATVSVLQGSLSIDTARYDLAPGTRAFGIRFNSAANPSGAADAWEDDYLTLFVSDGGKLSPVLGSGALDGGIPMELVTIEHGCMECQNNQGVKSGEGSVHMLPTITHGFHDVCVLYASPDIATSSPERTASLASMCRYGVYKYNGYEYVPTQGAPQA